VIDRVIVLWTHLGEVSDNHRATDPGTGNVPPENPLQQAGLDKVPGRVLIIKNRKIHRGVAMKRNVFATLAILSLSLISYTSIATDAKDRPAGVAAANWVPVSDRLGIVLVHNEARTVVSSTVLLLKPTVSGYYMVKGANGWTRLVIVEPVKGPADVG
jgi:hypothetical protein